MRTKQYILTATFVLVFALLSIGFVFGEDIGSYSTSSPFPSFQLAFNSHDAPVNITQAQLEWAGSPVLLSYTNNSAQSVFNFSTPAYLVQAQYTIAITAKDADGNEKEFQGTLDVQPDQMNMWVNQPPHFTYSPYKEYYQDVALTQTSPFNISFHTEFPALCRLARYMPAQNNTDYLFNNLMTHDFNQGSLEPSTTHNLRVTTSTNNRTRLQIEDQPFNYQDYAFGQSYWVICKQDTSDAFSSATYPSKIIYVGIDKQAPQIQASLQPETITDTANISTKLTITSTTQDLIGCRYEFVTNPAPVGYYPAQGVFPKELPQSIRGFHTNYSQTFSLQERQQYFAPQTSYEYALNISCHDLAMNEVHTTIPFSVELTPDFDISLQNPYVQEKKPTLRIATSSLARCRFQFSQGNAQQESEIEEEMTSLRNFTLTSNLPEDGTYFLDAHCISVAGEEAKTLAFTLDTQAPQAPVILSGRYSCETPMSLDIKAPENDTVSYHVTLRNISAQGSKLVAFQTEFTQDNFTFTLPNDIATPVNQTYVWEVVAQDKAGHNSTPTVYEVQRLASDELACDQTSPYAILDVTDTSTGYDLNITCKDYGSGCLPTYYYSTTTQDGTCAYDMSASLNETLAISKQEVFCYQVRDKAQNSYNQSVLLAQQVPPRLSLQEPLFGIGQTKQFSLLVRTSQPATCRQGPRQEITSSTPSVQYNTLEAFTLSNASTTHRLDFDAQSHAHFQATNEKEIYPWIVVCKNGQQYTTKEFDFGYDITPPEITITANPHPVTTHDQHTQLQVTTSDKSICTYRDAQGKFQTLGLYDVADEDTYTTTFATELSLWKHPYNEFIERVKCRNRAQLHNQADMVFLQEAPNPLQIRLNQSTFSQSPALVSVITNAPATCSYQMMPEGEYKDFQQTNTLQHKTSISLEHGKRPLHIRCTKGDLISSLYATIIIDTIKPTLHIAAPQETCSLTELTATLLADGTGSLPTTYTYWLENTQGKKLTPILTQEHANLSLSYEFSQGTEYVLQASVTDQAGHITTAQHTLQASSQTPQCDYRAPQITLQQKVGWKKTSVDITCQDRETGCTDYFIYYSTPFFTTPNNPITQGRASYKETPLQYSTSQKVTYVVFDQAHNQNSKTQDVLVKQQCFNGREDPDEQGIDCGGFCDASCETCSNNQQDAFEEGVDCGGICQTPCQAPPESQAECSITDDCPEGFQCSYQGECIEYEEPQEQETTDSDAQESDIRPLGVIFIILGILLLGGGVAFIYYSQTEQAKARRLAQRHVAMQSRNQSPTQQQAQVSAQRAAQQKAQAQHQAQQRQAQLYRQHKEERKHMRKDALSTFDSSGSSQEKSSTNKGGLSASQQNTSAQVSSKQHESEDENIEDYVVLGQKQPLPKNAQSTKDDPLEKLSHLHQPHQITSQQPTQHKQEAPQQKSHLEALSELLGKAHSFSATKSHLKKHPLQRKVRAEDVKKILSAPNAPKLSKQQQTHMLDALHQQGHLPAKEKTKIKKLFEEQL